MNPIPLFFIFATFLLSNGSIAGLTKSNYSDTLKKFIDVSKPNRSVGNPGHKAAAEYLRIEFEKLAKKYGGKYYEHRFFPDVEFASQTYQNDFDSKVRAKIPETHADYKKFEKFTKSAIAYVKGFEKIRGRNLVLEFTGTKKPLEVVYLGAHFDSTTHNHETLEFTPDNPTQGADDNAAAVAAILEIARAVAPLAKKFNRTLRIVAFDYEEVFFLGSYAFAGDISKAEATIGLFNLEMIGWSKKEKKNPTVKIYTRESNTKGFQNDLTLAALFEAAQKKAISKITPLVLKNGFDRSDNWSFWQRGLPAITITQDWENDFDEKNYHTSHDNFENLNLGYAFEITRTTQEAILMALR